MKIINYIRQTASFTDAFAEEGPPCQKKGILPVAIKTATIVVQNMVNVCVLAALGDLNYGYFTQNTQNLPDHVSYTVEFNL